MTDNPDIDNYEDGNVEISMPIIRPREVNRVFYFKMAIFLINQMSNRKKGI